MATRITVPLADETFKPLRLKGWRGLKAVGTPFADEPRFGIIANLERDAADPFKAAVAAKDGPVFRDVPNVTSKDPILVIGDRVGAG